MNWPVKLPSLPKPDQRSTVAEWSVTVLTLLFASSSLGWAFVVPTGSMENTILIGDHMIVDKMTYAPQGPVSRYLLPYTEVKRGDVIVFRYPLNIRMDYVKRVIGVPGDRIKIQNKQVFLNGRAVREPYKVHKTNYTDSYRDFFPSEPNAPLPEPARVMLTEHVENGVLVVPPGKYFAMGDNRDSSEDSRYWGFVPRENIVGKPWVIYWSFDGNTDQMKDAVNLDHLINVGLNFFTKTRWSRSFQVIRGYPLE